MKKKNLFLTLSVLSVSALMVTTVAVANNKESVSLYAINKLAAQNVDGGTLTFNKDHLNATTSYGNTVRSDLVSPGNNCLIKLATDSSSVEKDIRLLDPIQHVTSIFIEFSTLYVGRVTVYASSTLDGEATYSNMMVNQSNYTGDETLSGLDLNNVYLKFHLFTTGSITIDRIVITYSCTNE